MPVNQSFGKQNIEVYQALKGITTVPALQNQLDNKIGSLEIGKIADLVILDENPLDVPVDQIHKIKSCYTFVNGYKNKVYDEQDATNCQ